MKSNTVLSLVEDLQSKNEQGTMTTGEKNLYDVDTDWKLAYYFYHFLNGRTNKLPSFNAIQSTISNSTKKIISVGFGVDVALNETLYNSSQDLVVTSTEPINDFTTRIDKITKDNYEAYTLTIGKSPAEPINVDEFPKYDMNRVRLIQNYLNEYSKENNNGKKL